MIDDFDVENVFQGMKEARRRGHTPTELHVGINEAQSLLEEADFRTVTAPSKASSHLGSVAGLSVETVPAESARFMQVEDGEDVYYYII